MMLSYLYKPKSTATNKKREPLSEGQRGRRRVSGQFRIAQSKFRKSFNTIFYRIVVNLR